MDSQKPNTRTRGGKGMISLDTYIDFIDSHNQLNLTINYFNQIVSMHGFKKLHKVAKKVIIDAVNTIDLMNPPRSTLKDNISSSAFIPPEEVIADLNSLNWQECKVTSIQIINPLNENHSTQQLSLQNSDQPQPKSKPKSRSITGVHSLGSDGTTNSNSVCSSDKGGSAKKLVQKRKRKANHSTQQLTIQNSKPPQPKLKSVTDVHSHGFDGTTNSNLVCSSEKGGTAKKLVQKRKRKANHSTQQLSLQNSEPPQPKLKSVTDVHSHGFDGTTNSNSVCSSDKGGTAKKMVAKRKRKALHAVVGIGGDCGVAHSGTSTSPQLLLGSC